MVHAENGDAIDVLVKKALAEGHTEPKYHALTRPPETEGEATNRAIQLARVAGCALYVVHVSCKEAVEPIELAREKGWNVWGETCTQYFFIDYTFLEQPDFEGAKYVYTPPPRDKANQDVLWDAVRTDVLSAISTDHCAFTWGEQKAMGRDDFSKIPNGGPGLENRLHMIHHFGVREGRIGLNRMVELLCDEPGEALRPLSAEGDGRGRLRRGPRRLRPREAAHDHGREPAVEDGLQPLRGDGGRRRRRDGAPARQRDRRGRRGRRRSRGSGSSSRAPGSASSCTPRRWRRPRNEARTPRRSGGRRRRRGRGGGRRPQPRLRRHVCRDDDRASRLARRAGRGARRPRSAPPQRRRLQRPGARRCRRSSAPSRRTGVRHRGPSSRRTASSSRAASGTRPSSTERRTA